MDSLDRNLIALKALSAVYREGAYSNIALNEQLNEVKGEKDKAYITRLFYGVLGKETQLEYLLSRLTAKRPKPVAVIIIKMGLYLLRYMSQPDYAVIDTQVRLASRVGKRDLGGFINAVLRKSNTVKLPIKDRNPIFEISVNCSCPMWLVEVLLQSYGETFTREFLSAQIPDKTHIRLNERVMSSEKFIELTSGESSGVGYYVNYLKLKSLPARAYAVQSKASALACHYYSIGVKEGDEVLDLCSAPGGKAMFMASVAKAKVTACDIHPHRVKLIESYAQKQNLTVKTMVNDATVHRPEFAEKFDCVIVDAPCSGIGVIHSKPDITFNRSISEIEQLSALQLSILSSASAYVKKGGQLNYSTCTVIKDENEKVVEKFLETNSDFYLEHAQGEVIGCGNDGYVRLYPQTDNCDGFFVAKLRRKND